MSSPDVIDERFDQLVQELRASGLEASVELRQRVRAIATREPEPPARAGWPRPRVSSFRSRRTWLVLAPVAALGAVAVGLGVLTSGGAKDTVAAHTALEKAPLLNTATRAGLTRPAPKSADLSTSRATLPPSGSRLQLYAVEMQLRVGDLSETTKRALNVTRSFGGYIRSVQYGSGQEAGTAYLVLRVPVGKVQSAVVKLSALGTIVDQHVSIQDVQPQVDARFRGLQALREQVAGLEVKLAAPGLTEEQKAALELTLTRTQGRLSALELVQHQAVTRASFATVSLDLRTKKAAVVVPSKPGRIGEALHSIGRVLVWEAEILIYVFLIGAPFVALAALLWFGRRSMRRRSEEQLLAR